MQLPDFEHSMAWWDKFRAFHRCFGMRNTWTIDGPIVHFDTGEAMVTRSKWDPDDRKTYNDLRIQVLGTNDDTLRKFFLVEDLERPVPKSWVTREGTQTLWLDLDHEMAVALDAPMTADTMERVPLRLRPHAKVYYTGEDQPPIGGPIIVSRPKTHPKGLLEHVKGIESACTVWKCHNPKFMLWDNTSGTKGWSSANEIKKQSILKRDYDDYAEKEFRMLSDDERYLIAVNPIRGGFTKETHAFLKFKVT